LSQLNPIKIEPVNFRLGNGQFLIANSGLKFELSIQGHRFKILGLIADHSTGIDVILGTQTLSELDGTLDFRSNRFKIK
jgi:hypothetical protein